jgi:hypothetical protein
MLAYCVTRLRGASVAPHSASGQRNQVANLTGSTADRPLTAKSDDLIHADRHGAIVIPLGVAAKLPEATELCGRRETPILGIARSPNFSLEKLKAALMRSAEIH